MVNLFQFAPNDASLGYLVQIFGNMNGIIPSPSGGLPAGGSVTLLGTMFKTFNGIVLTVGALMLVYITVVGVMVTAHEGEFMGKQYHKIWTPLKTVLGIVLLVPLGSGYSTIQIVMMWVIVQGIGAADSVWQSALIYLKVAGSPYAQISAPTVGAFQTTQQLFKGLVCDASARFSQPNPTPSIASSGYYCGGPRVGDFCNSEGAPPFNPNATTYQLGPQGSCGTLTYCSPCSDMTDIKCLGCQAQITALANIIPTLAGIAQKIAQLDYAYRDFYKNSWNTADNPDWQFIYDYCAANGVSKESCCQPSFSPFAMATQSCKSRSPTFFPSPYKRGYGQNPEDAAVSNIYWPYGLQPLYGKTDFINTAVNYYASQMDGVMTAYIQSKMNTGDLTDDLKDAYTTGWIFAGSYYYIVAQMNNDSQKNAMPTLSMSTQIPITGSSMDGLRNNTTTANAVLNSTAGSSGGALGAISSLGSSGVGSIVDSGMGSVGKNFATLSGSTANPVVQMQSAGFALLIITQALFSALVLATIVLGIAGNINVWAAGFGVMDPVGPAAILMYFVFVPAIFALFGLMITYGGLLGVYVPLIPYVIFTFGAIAWFLATIEAMVAGPLVALGILSPSGGGHGHEILGKAEPALMLLFSIFLRPTLMIFGLMAAILLATVIGNMINTAFWGPVAAAIARGGIESSSGQSAGSKVVTAAAFSKNILEFIIFLGAYIAIMVAALNKCFSAIHILPERVLSWISGHAVPGGETGLEEMKGAVTKAAAGVTGGLGAAKGAIGGVGKGFKKYAEEAGAQIKPGGTKPPAGAGEGGEKKPEK